MEAKRVHRKIERSPEDLKRLSEVREKFQREKPTLEEIDASGEYYVISQPDLFSLLQTFAALKKARQERNLSLADVAERSGIDKAALSRLENGQNSNPTFMTLESVARAIGVGIRIVVDNPMSANS